MLTVQLCEEFFLNGAPGQCQEQDTCCGVLNYTETAFTVQIYCCHDNEKLVNFTFRESRTNLINEECSEETPPRSITSVLQVLSRTLL